MRFALLVFSLLFVLDGCAAAPANIADTKSVLTEYKNSGAYDRDVAALANEAQAYIEAQASGVLKPAIVLDIDETSLSNWPWIAANDYGVIRDGSCSHLPKGPCGSHAWQNFGKDEAIAPMLALFQSAQAHRVAVFFITGRDESLRAATVRNLHRAGYHGWKELVMRPKGSKTPSAADYKAPHRARIETLGYTIIANIGDQPSDLAGGHAQREFLVPNPFYHIP